jgi:hypothetical protein
MPPHANAFDSELATLDMTELEDTTLTDTNPNGGEEQRGNNASAVSRRDYIVPRNGETFH